MKAYPKIFLTIDNCFAKKRWTRPEEWMNVTKDLGVTYIEASADTELDPLYMGVDYLKTWVDEVKEAEQKTGQKVVTLYSGQGTYSTLGLTHTHDMVRDRIIRHWYQPMIDAAAELDAGFGFFSHAFSEAVLQDPAAYADCMEILLENLTRINQYGKDKKCKFMCLEQMYSPHQYPYTIKDTMDVMNTIADKSGYPFYFTEDLGHHHVKFLRPSRSEIQGYHKQKKTSNIWLGPDTAFDIYYQAVEGGQLGNEQLDNIEQEMDRYPYMFTQEQDNDCYKWLRMIGCYSPVIHLQQTDGVSSNHLPFTEEENEKGMIRGDEVLRALKESYDNPPSSELPLCNEIYFTFELFFGTAAVSKDILHVYKESVEYWRRFIPEDGLPLDVLVKRLA